MLAKFEQNLEVLTDDIHKFWQDLVNDKDAFPLYRKGLVISKQVSDFQQLFSDIDRK